jgi:hypothetical protein
MTPVKDRHLKEPEDVGFGSEIVKCSLCRNNVPLGKSAVGLVKIDRVIPGEKGFCGP